MLTNKEGTEVLTSVPSCSYLALPRSVGVEVQPPLTVESGCSSLCRGLVRAYSPIFTPLLLCAIDKLAAEVLVAIVADVLR